MSCHTTVCLGTLRTADGVPIDVHTNPHSGAAVGASVDGAALFAESLLSCAVPSKLAAHLHAAMTTHATTSSSPATFYLLGPALTETRCGDLVASHLARLLLSTTPSSHAETTAHECMLFGTEDKAVTCETLTADDAPSTVERVLAQLEHITLVAARFDACVCVVVVSTQLSTAHIASLVSAAPAGSATSLYVYLGESMTAAEMRMACTELEAVKTTVSDFTAPLATSQRTRGRTPHHHHYHNGGRPSLAEAPPSVSRVLNTTVSDDGRREGGFALDIPPPLSRSHANGRGLAEEAAVQRELLLLREALARVEADRDAAEMERRACQGVLQSYRERFAEMDERDVPLLHAIHRDDDHDVDGPHAHGEDPLVATRLRQQLDDAMRALDVSEERVRLLQFRAEMGTTQAEPATMMSRGATAEAVAELRRENLDLAALLQDKDRASTATIESLHAQLMESEHAKADLLRAVEMQSQTIREAKEAVVAERARHDAELAEALDAVKALSRDNSHSATASASQRQSALPVRSPSSLKPLSGRHRRYASPHPPSTAPLVDTTADADGSDLRDAVLVHRGPRSATSLLTSPPR